MSQQGKGWVRCGRCGKKTKLTKWQKYKGPTGISYDYIPCANCGDRLIREGTWRDKHTK